jgi:hypothetical protein
MQNSLVRCRDLHKPPFPKNTSCEMVFLEEPQLSCPDCEMRGISDHFCPDHAAGHAAGDTAWIGKADLAPQ